jgi:hypothetical protein
MICRHRDCWTVRFLIMATFNVLLLVTTHWLPFAWVAGLCASLAASNLLFSALDWVVYRWRLRRQRAR